MRLDQYGTNNGRASVDMSDKSIVVGRKYRMRIIYTAGPEGISAGGCLRFTLPVLRDNEHIPQPGVSCSNPDVRLKCSSDTSVINGKEGREFFLNTYLFVSIENEPMKEGETVSVAYHDPGTTARFMGPKYAHRYGVEVATDVDGSRRAPGSGFYLVKDAPAIQFVNDRPARIDITIPSSTIAGTPFEAVVRIRDAYNNIAEDYHGNVRLLEACSGGSVPVDSGAFTPGDKGVRTFNAVFDKEGINRIKAEDRELQLHGRSNASRTTGTEAPLGLFWGETHVHTAISADSAAINSCIPRPRGVYDYARNTSDLDFCMVTDHSENIVEDDWKETQAAAEECYEPHRFVTFSGFEATHDPLRDDGDKNVYFFTDDQDFINQGTTEDLYARLKKNRGKAMVIPHQHWRTNWELHDPELEKVVEVYSHWGCGLSAGSDLPMIPVTRLRPENYVSHALERGVRSGFIASADHSFGHPGDDFWWGLSDYHGGLAAAYASSLTREGVWDALWNRRCYATTRARILLEVEINGRMMGEEFSVAPGDDRRISVNVYGTDVIEKVEIIKNGRILHEEAGTEELDLEFSHVDTEAERQTDYYYVHVKQADGEHAWSSPVWIDI